MRIKKIVRFLALIIFIVIASIIPFPINFYKKDKSPPYVIELIEEKDEEENKEDEYQAYS